MNGLGKGRVLWIVLKAVKVQHFFSPCVVAGPLGRRRVVEQDALALDRFAELPDEPLGDAALEADAGAKWLTGVEVSNSSALANGQEHQRVVSFNIDKCGTVLKTLNGNHSANVCGIFLNPLDDLLLLSHGVVPSPFHAFAFCTSIHNR